MSTRREKIGHPGGQETHGYGAEGDGDQISWEDAERALAQKIDQLRVTQPALNDQIAAEYEETVDAQPTEGYRGVRQTVEKLARWVAVGELWRVREQHQRCEENPQQVEGVVSSALPSDGATLL